MSERFHIHLVSDSTGETVSSIYRSVLSQFDDIEAEEHIWSLVRTQGQMERAIEGIKAEPGIVIYTIVDEDNSEILHKACKKLKVPCVPALLRVTKEMTKFLGVEANLGTGRQYELDEEYFERVEAINFTLAHDDGQNTANLENADIVLVGPSRTSKTPTCVYLSYRGIYAANVPYVKGVSLPDILFDLKNPLVIGLTISPERLVQIRKSRLDTLQEKRETTYIDIEEIKEEVAEARKIFNKNKWPTIDVTRKSIEETVAKIMQLYSRYKEHEHD